MPRQRRSTRRWLACDLHLQSVNRTSCRDEEASPSISSPGEIRRWLRNTKETKQASVLPENPNAFGGVGCDVKVPLRVQLHAIRLSDGLPVGEIGEDPIVGKNACGRHVE